jgi:RHS repeat-associated protein
MRGDMMDWEQDGRDRRETSLGGARRSSPPRDDRSLPPSISLPKGGGALRSIDEKFTINAANGTCSLSVPLPFSKARSDVGLNLSLEYNSGSGNSAFGLGWNVALPSIHRRTDKQLPLYEDAIESDVFVFSGAEDLVPAFVEDLKGNWAPDIAGTGAVHVRRYRPRIDSQFSRIEKISIDGESGFYWKVTTRDNVVTIFGRTTAARLSDPNDPSRIFRWLPEWTYDDRGNCVEFTYKDEDLANVPNSLEERNRHNALTLVSNKYLKHIRYGNTDPYFPGSLATPFDPPAPQIKSYLFDAILDYGEHDPAAPSFAETQPWPCRFDPFSDCRPGFEIRTYRLCRRILFFHSFDELQFSASPCLVRSLDFTYQEFHFDGSPHQYQEADFIISIQRTFYSRSSATSYDAKSWPALELTYQPLSWSKTVENVAPEDVIGTPGGVTPGYEWLDYFGDGAPGILTEQADRWYFKSNLGGGRFDRPQVIAEKPSFSGLDGATLDFQDLAADGSKQLVSLSSEPRGYFELDDDDRWLPFRQFARLVNLDFRDPNTRLLDLNGDGAPDLLISEDFVFRWHSSLGRLGYDEAQFSSKPFDEESGPAILFGDGTQTVMTADMNGDGLTDIVRVRNGEVCYWANLGYGRFGAKVSMRDAPLFDLPDRFDPARVQFADVSGTGAADLIYLGRGGFAAWINLAGNGWSAAQSIDPFPGTELPNRVFTIDILGNGTASLVWSSELPASSAAPLRYVDLMGGKKPYMLAGYRNNFGTNVALEYKGSAHFALLDRRDGRPWATKLPFPTQCVSRVETTDTVTGARFVRLYRYRHGYYDHAEREFRGFGMVEETDTESFDDFQASGASNIVDETVFQAPVRTRTWFHTGAYIRGVGILRQFAEDYYQGATKPEFGLPDAAIDTTILGTAAPSPLELREAARTCKGMMLRQEIYADDASPQPDAPYSTTEHTSYIRMLQPRLANRYAVFLAHESQTLTYHYERDPSDPRIAHELNTVVDAFGYAVETASVVYGRLNPDPTLPAEVTAAQGLRATYRVNNYTQDNIVDGVYRPRVLCETQVYELTGASPSLACFTLKEIRDRFQTASPLPYETRPTAGMLQKRPISHERTLFAADADPNTPLALGLLGALGLPYENYRLAFTPSLLNTLYSGRVTPSMLSEGGHLAGDAYVGSGLFPATDPAGFFWSRAGTAQYPINPGQSFFLPSGHLDPFGNQTKIRYYGAYHLLIDQITDPLGNVTSADRFDFRFLLPQAATDINGNHSEVSFDIFGLVVGLALQGKGAEADNLIGFAPDLAQPQIDAFLNDPAANGGALLQNATSRFVYSFASLPAVAATIRRETHSATALAAGAPSKLQFAFEYSDGAGRIAMKKIQTEPGRANQITINPNDTFTLTVLDTTPDLRWIGTGRTVVNNKNNPVMQYEPYFSTNPGYETDQRLVATGVTPVWHYDPLDRQIRTDFPDGSFATATFDAWKQALSDRNDNVQASAWYTARIGGAMGIAEQTAAKNTSVHNNTPQVQHFDALGRIIYSVDDNKFVDRKTGVVDEEFHPTLVTLDIAGNRISVRDARSNLVMQYAYDMLNRAANTASMDAGARVVLPDTTGQPLYHWDAKGNRFHTVYDALRRPLQREVFTPAPTTIVYEKLIYGTDATKNQNGRLLTQYDQSGVVSYDLYDFKGNLLSSARRFTSDFQNDIDWSNPGLVVLDPPSYPTTASFDALDRVTTGTTPDNSVVAFTYTQSGLLGGVGASLRGAASRPFILSVIHDEKLRRQKITYANGAVTTLAYDPLTFRIQRILTVRSSDNATLQDLNYTYDPVGNITQIRDDAQETIFFNNQIVSPQNDFIYDAVYRLVSATGREHIGQNAPVSEFDETRTNLPHPSDGNGMQRYLQQYDYDFVGNLLNMVHSSGVGPFINQWTRQFTPAATSNRLMSSQVGATSENYSYDLHGNMTALAATPALNWDFKDQLRSIDLGGGGTAYYTYDVAGNRARKVIQRRSGPLEQRLYLGTLEIYAQIQGGAPQLERQTMHLMDGTSRLAMIDSRTIGDDGTPAQLIRYQFANHLGTAVLELDDAAQIISYEEYYPYGSTSFQSVDASREVPARRYRYTGKERDEESGLYYHGARYYAPWLGRWTACDPQPRTSTVSLFQFVGNNPIKLIDPSGAQETPAQDKKLSLWEQTKLLARLTFIVETKQTPEAFARGIEEKVRSVTVDPVMRLYGPKGMIDKAAQKIVDRATGQPERDYVTEDEHKQMLRDIVSVGGSLFPGAGEVGAVGPGPQLAPAVADTGVATVRAATVSTDTTAAGVRGLAMATSGGSSAAPQSAGGKSQGSQSFVRSGVRYELTGDLDKLQKTRPGAQVYIVRNAKGEQIYVGITGTEEGAERAGEKAARDAITRLKEHLEKQPGEWIGSASKLEIVGEGLSERQALALEQDLIQANPAGPGFNKDLTPYETKFGASVEPDPQDISAAYNTRISINIRH